MLNKCKKYEVDFKAMEACHSLEFADAAQCSAALVFFLYVANNLIMKAVCSKGLVCKESQHGIREVCSTVTPA